MAEVTNELIYEVSKAMQARLGNMDESIRELRGVRGGIQAVQHQVAAVQADIGNLYETYGTMDGRLSRIERRLDIIDSPVS